MPGISASVIPSLNDLGGMLRYLFGNPYLFISSTTAMTSGLLGVAIMLEVATVPFMGIRTQPLRRILRRLAPTVVLILAYFGVGSLALSAEIYLRFHASIPYETEIQLASGIGHFVLAVLGILALAPACRRLVRAEWATGNLWAVSYLSLHIIFLTPPWFAFQGQGPMILGIASGLAALGLANGCWWYEKENGSGRKSVR